MKNLRKKNLILIILVFIFGFSLLFNTNFNNEIIITNKPKASDYLELNPFIIRDGGIGPKDYTWAEAVMQPWCTGGGTKNNPYVISNIIINGQAQDLCCIYIVSSTVFFKIKDCIFYNSRHVAYGGIKLSHVSNGQILYNKCFNNTVGIRIEDSDNININNNIINDNEYGLMMFSTSQINIISNNASNNHYGSGIRVYNGDSYRIIGNIANNNHYGLSLGGNSNEILMSNNYAKGNYYGIGIYSTFNSALINNTVLNSHTGIDFMDSNNNIVNYCDVFNSDGDVLYMYESFDNNFSFNKFSHNNWGISMRKCDGNKFEQNEISSNSYHGIRLSGSNKNELVQNEIIFNSDQGIKLISGSQFNNVSGNIISNPGSIGIDIDSGCNNNLFYENFFLKNERHAIDDGTDNNWNNTKIGNYWDDYTGKDANDDGIGDTPYNIAGTANSKDNYPIWDDGPGIPLGIPGYNLYILICLLSVISVISIKRQKK